MSQNPRQQQYPRGRLRIKLTTTKRREDSISSLSSTPHLSDDEGYSGVENVSESDDDDENHVDAIEEDFIKNPARSLEEENDADEEDEDDEDDQLDEDEDEDDDDDGAEWPGANPHFFDLPEQIVPFGLLDDDDEATPVVERHVRFAGIPDSDSDSTSTDTDDSVMEFWPDIFIDQSTLDPSFRREMENEDNLSDSSGSFWDFHNASHEGANDESDKEFDANYDVPSPRSRPSAVHEDEDGDDDLDGYETDEEGDTTDEDIPEPAPRKRQMTKRPVADEATSDSDTPTSIRHVKGRPRAARFNLERSDEKPIGVYDPVTKKMIIFTPQKKNSSVDIGTEHVNTYSALMDDNSWLGFGALMASGTLGDLTNMSAFGLTEGLFPSTSDILTGEESDESGYCDMLDNGYDEYEEGLRFEEFLDFHNNCSEDDQSEQDWNDDPESSPTRPKTAASSVSATTNLASAEVHPLLNHFESNSNAVGAFRKNQVNQQLINSEIATQESLSFSTPYHYGTLRGIKSGSMGTVTTPITPVRRQKSNSMVGLNGPPDFAPGSPLNRPSQKRKAPGNDDPDSSAHKRRRSMPDMDTLRLQTN